MVIRIIFVFLLVGLFVNPVMSATEKTGLQLLSDCKMVIRVEDGYKMKPEDSFDYMGCASYVDGVVDMIALDGDFARESNCSIFPRFICLPSTISTLQAIRIVVKYLEDNPEQLHMTKRLLINEAMMKAFPCDKAKK